MGSEVPRRTPEGREETFTYFIEVEPQYRDLDPNGHVNHAVYSGYFEQARAKYWDDVIGLRHDRAELALVHLEIDYAAELSLGDRATVAMRIPELGESSMPMDYELRTDEGVAATGSVVLVAYDREAGKPKPIPEDWRRAIVEYEGLDE